MEESPREKIATWIGLISTIVPGMMVCGFMPKWNVLPLEAWVAIAALGSMIAGAIATHRLMRGAICGLIAGLGVMIGIWLYVAIRVMLTGNKAFFDFELALGGFLGGLPGLLLFNVWARESEE